jgi:hypothetical protein
MGRIAWFFQLGPAVAPIPAGHGRARLLHGAEVGIETLGLRLGATDSRENEQDRQGHFHRTLRVL